MDARGWYEVALQLAAERGWSQAQLSERSGVSETKLSRWKKPEQKIFIEDLPPVARALDLNPVEMLVQIGVVTPAEVSRHAARSEARDLSPVEIALRMRDAVEMIYEKTQQDLRDSGLSEEEIAEAVRQARQRPLLLPPRADPAAHGVGPHALADEADAVPEMLLREGTADTAHVG